MPGYDLSVIPDLIGNLLPLCAGESFTQPPLKIIFRCSCSEKPIFIGLASQRTGFAGTQ